MEIVIKDSHANKIRKGLITLRISSYIFFASSIIVSFILSLEDKDFIFWRTFSVFLFIFILGIPHLYIANKFKRRFVYKILCKEKSAQFTVLTNEKFFIEDFKIKKGGNYPSNYFFGGKGFIFINFKVQDLDTYILRACRKQFYVNPLFFEEKEIVYNFLSKGDDAL